MRLALLLLSLLAAPPAPKKAEPPPQRPHRLELAADRELPLVGSPSLSPDGKELVFARFGVPHPRLLQRQGKLFIADLAHPEAARAIDVPGPNVRNYFRSRLSLDGTQLAYLAQGELWTRTVAEGAATRLYPPKEGDATLGPALSHFAWGPDGSWLLIQSPKGWARVAVASGEIAPLTLPPIDLSNGSLAFEPDGRHAVFVRPRAGPGWENGARVVVLNIETGQAQLADFDHDYTDVLVLTDAEIIGKDSDGVLWALRGRSRLLYYRPPAPPKGASISQYSVSGDMSEIAYVVGQGNGFSYGRSEIMVGPAPVPPSRKAKREEPPGADR